MPEPKYLLAKYVPDTLRMEPLNIGVILWASGSIACKFLPAESAPFNVDAAVYNRWIEYWIDICSRPVTKLNSGEEVSRKSPLFLSALLESQRGAYRVYEAGTVLRQVAAEDREDAVASLFQTLVAVNDEESIARTPRESLELRCNAIFQKAGLWDREEFISSAQLDLVTAGTSQPFKFDHIWKNGHLGALFQRVNLRMQPSTTNAAFLFEHAVRTPDAKDAKRFAMIDSSSTKTDDSTETRREMLSRLCRVVDVADQKLAVEAVSEVLSL